MEQEAQRGSATLHVGLLFLALSGAALLACCKAGGDDSCERRCMYRGPEPPVPGGEAPTNHCVVRRGEHSCVRTCKADAECDPRFFGKCTFKADDGTKFCADDSPLITDAGPSLDAARDAASKPDSSVVSTSSDAAADSGATDECAIRTLPDGGLPSANDFCIHVGTGTRACCSIEAGRYDSVHACRGPLQVLLCFVGGPISSGHCVSDAAEACYVHSLADGGTEILATPSTYMGYGDFDFAAILGEPCATRHPEGATGRQAHGAGWWFDDRWG